MTETRDLKSAAGRDTTRYAVGVIATVTLGPEGLGIFSIETAGLVGGAIGILIPRFGDWLQGTT